jgi:hypothetical protein
MIYLIQVKEHIKKGDDKNEKSKLERTYGRGMGNV